MGYVLSNEMNFDGESSQGMLKGSHRPSLHPDYVFISENILLTFLY